MGGDATDAVTLAGGRESPLWQALKKHGADLYLCGEARTLTCTQADGILQIAHGGQFSRGPVNYLVATVYPDRIDLEVKEITLANEGGSSSEKVRISEEVRRRGFTTAGTAVLHRDQTGLALSRPTGSFEKTSLP